MSIIATKTWIDGEFLNATDLNARFVNCETSIATIATQSEMDAGIATTTALAPYLNRISLGTEVASTSGTSITFSSIPSGTRRITIQLVGVSTSGTSNLIVQLGDAGGIEASGYLGSCTTIASATPSTSNFTTGMGITNAVAAASVSHGTITLTLERASTFYWVGTSLVAFSNAATTNIGAFSKALSQELTQVRLTTSGGADTFDAGVVNISYER